MVRAATRRRYKGSMKHFLLFYDGAPDYFARRPQFRDAHLGHAWAAAERGELVVAGAFADPVDGAVLMFAGESWQRAHFISTPRNAVLTMVPFAAIGTSF